MPDTIDPAEFTRLMTLPANDRHRLLEFIGSSFAGHVGTAELFRQAMTASAVRQPSPGEGKARGDRH